MSEKVAMIEVGKKTSTSWLYVSLVLALAAGAAVWGFIREKHPVFKVPAKYNIGMGAPPEQIMALVAQQDLAERKNGMVVMAVACGLLAGAVALGTPVCCSGLWRLLVAVPWGALWGAGTGFLSVTAYQILVPRAVQPTVADAVKLQSLLFAMLGVGVGLLIGAFGRSSRSILAGAVGGVLAGVVGGIAYPIAAAVLFSGDSTEGLIPNGDAIRLLWLGLSFASIAVIVPLAVCPPNRHEPSTAETTIPDADKSAG